MANPFKLIEPEDQCPPELKNQIVSELDSIRNSLKVIELYSGDFFAAIFSILAPPPAAE